MQRFTPPIVEAARPRRHAAGNHWFVDETYVKVNGSWRYVCRAVDQDRQVIDVLVSVRRDAESVRRYFARAMQARGAPDVVTTDKAALLRWTQARTFRASHLAEHRTS